MTEPQTRELLSLLAAAYPNASIGPETVAVYVTMLADLEASDAQAAVKQLLSECRFFPTIAEIRQTVAERSVHLPAATEAWGEVMQTVRDVGFYGKPDWSSDAIRLAVRAIGWENVCQCERDDLNTLRAQFERIYAAYRARVVQGANLAGLGLPEPTRPRELSTWDEGPRAIGSLVPFRRAE